MSYLTPQLAFALGLLLSLGSSGTAYAYCDAHWVNGNEAVAPEAFARAFERRDWGEAATLLTDDAALTLVSDSTITAAGRAAITKSLNTFLQQNTGSFAADEDGLGFGEFKLMSHHWVTSRLFPHFKESKAQPGPIMIPLHGPPYIPSYSAAFLPDCAGKIERIVIVERNFISG